jgi:thiamine-phosphate pyrophosphorylase
MPAIGTDHALADRRARAAKLRGLYAVTPDMADTAQLLARVGAALSGGARAIQYRNKSASPTLRSAQAAALATVVARAAHPALYIVNDDAALAAAVEADGVHLGEDDGALAAARRVVGPERLIGVSCYNNFDLARDAVAAGADYVAFGSFFASSVKPGARRAEVALLLRAKALGVPVVAIGGITASNAAAIFAAGADAAAVISDVFAHPEIDHVASAASAIDAAFRAARRTR